MFTLKGSENETAKGVWPKISLDYQLLSKSDAIAIPETAYIQFYDDI